MEFNVAKCGNKTGIYSSLQWEVRLTENFLWAAAWHPSGKYIAASTCDMVVIILADTGCEILRFKTIHKKSIRKLSWDRTGKLLCACSFDGTVSIFTLVLDSEEKSKIRIFLLDSLDGHDSEVKSCAFHHSKNLVATCSRDKSTWVWEYFFEYSIDSEHESYQECKVLQSIFMIDGTLSDLLGSINFYFYTECAAVLEDHTQDVKSVIWSPFNDELLSCGYDNTVRVWSRDVGVNQEDWSLKETLNGHASTIWDINIYQVSHCAEDMGLHRNQFLISVGSNMDCLLWLRSLEESKQNCWKSVGRINDLHMDSILTCNMSPRGFLLTSSADSSICITEMSNTLRSLQSTSPSSPTTLSARHLQHTRITDAHSGDVTCSAWNPANSSNFFSCGEDGFLKLWNIN